SLHDALPILFAHHRYRVRSAGRGEPEVAVIFHGEQAVALHPGHGLADRRPALVQPLGDARTQGGHPLLLEFEDGAQIHLRGVDQVVHSLPSWPKCYLAVPEYWSRQMLDDK